LWDKSVIVRWGTGGVCNGTQLRAKVCMLPTHRLPSYTRPFASRAAAMKRTCRLKMGMFSYSPALSSPLWMASTMARVWRSLKR